MIRNCSRRGTCRTQPQPQLTDARWELDPPPADELDQSLVGSPFHNSQYTNYDELKNQQYTTQTANGARAESAFGQEGA